jgi:hypothetical protein
MLSDAAPRAQSRAAARAPLITHPRHTHARRSPHAHLAHARTRARTRISLQVAAYEAELVRAREERAARAAAERAAFEAELNAKHRAEMARLASEDARLTEAERATTVGDPA